MATRLDRSLWSAVWSQGSRGSLAPHQFEALLAQGANPWTIYANSSGEPKTVLEAVCSASRADFKPMLSSWIKHAGDLKSPPPAHPQVALCLPMDASLGAIEALAGAGADFSGPSALTSYVQRGVASKDPIASANFWAVAKNLAERSDTPLSSLPLAGCNNPRTVLMAICTGKPSIEIPEEGLELLLADKGWDFSWQEESDYGVWIQEFLVSCLRRGGVAPRMLANSSMDWKAVDAQGNNLAHLLVSRTLFSYDGREVLPIDALRECVAMGIDFRKDNLGQWSAIQRINAIAWSNEDQVAPLRADLQHQKLIAATPLPAATHSRRI